MIYHRVPKHSIKPPMSTIAIELSQFVVLTTTKATVYNLLSLRITFAGVDTISIM